MLVRQIPIAGEREEFIDWCAELSEGLSGREIRTCMRIALPKPLMDAGSIEAKLTLDHLKDSIHQVKQAHAEVGSSVSETRSTARDAAIAKRMLGIGPNNQ